NWAKFANTLKLRILLRQSEIGVTDYSSVNNGIGFINETVYCNPGYINDTNKQNPLYAAFGKTVAGDPAANFGATRATDYVALKLNQSNDGRKLRIFAPVGTGTNVVGIAQNDQFGPFSNTLSAVGPGILKSSSQSGIIMQKAESLLLQAEAVARGFIAGDAEVLYNAAVQASFDELGAGSAASYLANDKAYPAAGTLDQKIEAIIYQKWVALMGTNGIENWIEFRRTGYPDIPVAPNASSSVAPVRLLYPSSEYATNPDNVPAQTSTDAFTSLVFWDTNN
ncbi:MAG: SusD/RagB family nutrient-binding outer membrane lipoprotein, partial [Flavobacterium sp.]